MHSSHLLFVQSAHRGRVSIPKVRCPNDIVRASRAEGYEKTAFVEFGKVMKSIEAISGTQRDHEPACSGGSLIKAATRFMEDLQSQNRARMGTMKPGSRQCELADPFYDSDLRRFTTAVTEARAWKALVEVAGDKGVVLPVAAFAARTRARIVPRGAGPASRPALSARPQVVCPVDSWNKSGLALIQKPGQTNFLLETVDMSALQQVPAVHTCRIPLFIPLFSLHYEKLGFITRYRRTRCAYDEPERAVSGEFRRVRVGFKQPHGSLPDRSGDKVVPPQLPSRRWFMFRSCRLPAAATCRVSHPRIALRFAQQSPLTRGQDVEMMSAPVNR